MEPSDPAASQPVSVVAAAAHLGLNPDTLRYHLTKAGHSPKVGVGGRAYLTIPIDEAAAIIRKRREVAESAAHLPGWSAAQVAEALGIRTDTVHRLRQLGKLPAEYRVEGMGHRKWRWKPATVRAYARRVRRTLAEDDAPTVSRTDALVPEQRRLAAELTNPPGWSASQVAGALGIRLATVYHLRELGKLPAEIQAATGFGNRKWRWDPAEVRAYAERVGRTLAE